MKQRQQTQPLILIVDDSEDMRYLLEQILDEENYNLLFAEDGATALSQAQSHHPDLVLMDMSLPGMSGWEAVILLRQQKDFDHIPIIAITAHVSTEDQERAQAIGCNAHLGKPFDVVTVLNTIQHFLPS